MIRRDGRRHRVSQEDQSDNEEVPHFMHEDQEGNIQSLRRRLAQERAESARERAELERTKLENEKLRGEMERIKGHEDNLLNMNYHMSMYIMNSQSGNLVKNQNQGRGRGRQRRRRFNGGARGITAADYFGNMTKNEQEDFARQIGKKPKDDIEQEPQPRAGAYNHGFKQGPMVPSQSREQNKRENTIHREVGSQQGSSKRPKASERDQRTRSRDRSHSRDKRDDSKNGHGQRGRPHVRTERRKRSIRESEYSSRSRSPSSSIASRSRSPTKERPASNSRKGVQNKDKASGSKICLNLRYNETPAPDRRMRLLTGRDGKPRILYENKDEVIERERRGEPTKLCECDGCHSKE